MIKKITSLFLICTAVLSFGSFVHAAVINEVMEEKTIMRGVTYQHIRRLEEYGFQDVHVTKVDLTEPGIKLEVLKSKNGESFLENTYQLAVENDALCAINADFFAAKKGQSGRGSAVGVEIRDGELKSSASVTESMNTLYKPLKEDAFYIDAFTFDMTVKTANGKTDKIKVVNKYDDLTGIVLYTDDWGEQSVGSVGGSLEISVDKNGKVLEKVQEAEPLTIPKGGYVLASHLSYNTFLLDNVQVGDTISIDIKSAPDLEGIETAVGGGGVILRDGVVPKTFSHTISGRQPRSAVGVDKTGTVITMVVLDGRTKESVGMTQMELGNLMAELGCYTALNFDGGGSSLMALEEDGTKTVVNNPSDGSYRKVTNALAVTTDVAKNMPAASIFLDAQDSVFVNTGLDLKVVGLDAYQRTVSVDTKKVSFQTDNGTIGSNTWYPARAGVAHVTAKYGKLEAKKTFTVLENPREINFAEKSISLKSGESYMPALVGKDINGKKAKIRLSDTQVTISGEVATVNGNLVTAKRKGATVLTAKIGDITANTVILIDGAAEISAPKNIAIPDVQNTHQELTDKNSYRFCVFGNTRKITTLYDKLLVNRSLYKMKQDSEFQVFLGANVFEKDIQKVCENTVLAKNYNCFQKDGSTFITLPNVSGKVYVSDASVWTKFQQDVQNAGKNLFIFLDRNFITNDAAEKKVFYRTVNSAAAKGKNVYVFGGGFVNQNTIDDGVRYINTAGIFPSIAIDGTSPSYIEYVSVTVNGDQVTYTYKPVMGD